MAISLTSTATDSFDVGTGNLEDSADWDALSGNQGLGYSSNQAARNRSATGSSSTVCVKTGPSTSQHYLQYDITALLSDHGAIIRGSGGFNCIGIRYSGSGNTWYLFQRDSGTYTTENSFTAPVSSTVTLTDDGSSGIAVFVDQLTTADQTLTSSAYNGSPTRSIFFNNNSVSLPSTFINNWEQGDWETASAAPTVTDAQMPASATSRTVSVTSISTSGTVDGYLVRDVADGAGAPATPSSSDPDWVYPAPTTTVADDSLDRDFYFAAKNGSEVSSWFGPVSVAINIVEKYRAYEFESDTLLATVDYDDAGFDPDNPEIVITGLTQGTSYSVYVVADSSLDVDSDQSAIVTQTVGDSEDPVTAGAPAVFQSGTDLVVDMPLASDNNVIDHYELEIDINSSSYSVVNNNIAPDEYTQNGIPLGIVRYTYDASGLSYGDTYLFRYRAADPAGNVSTYEVQSSIATFIGPLSAPTNVSISYPSAYTVRVSHDQVVS